VRANLRLVDQRADRAVVKQRLQRHLVGDRVVVRAKHHLVEPDPAVRVLERAGRLIEPVDDPLHHVGGGAVPLVWQLQLAGAVVLEGRIQRKDSAASVAAGAVAKPIWRRAASCSTRVTVRAVVPGRPALVQHAPLPPRRLVRRRECERLHPAIDGRGQELRMLLHHPGRLGLRPVLERRQRVDVGREGRLASPLLHLVQGPRPERGLGPHDGSRRRCWRGREARESGRSRRRHGRWQRRIIRRRGRSCARTGGGLSDPLHRTAAPPPHHTPHRRTAGAGHACVRAGQGSRPAASLEGPTRKEKPGLERRPSSK
jgi:hypothetical protein